MSDISAIVAVTISVGATLVPQPGSDTLNIVGSSARLPPGDRIRFYSTLTGVGEDFQSTDPEYLAAKAYFSASPTPTKLAISRRLTAQIAAELIGGAATQVLATYQAVGAGGSMAITVDGIDTELTGMDFTAVASLNAVAAIVQTHLVSSIGVGIRCVWDGTHFVITGGTTGISASLSYASAGSTGTSVHALMALDAASGGVLTAGMDPGSVTQEINDIARISNAWYGLALTAEATQADILEAAAWTEAAGKKHYPTDVDAGEKNGTSTTSTGYLLRAAGYKRTSLMYSSDPYAGVAYAGRELTTDFSQPDSAITMKFKQLGGIATTPLTETERLVLVANNVNYYTTFGGNPMVAEGVQCDGTYSDQVLGLDWLKREISRDAFAALYSAPAKVAQTDKGVAGVVQRIENAFAQGVLNGLLAPGIWTGSPLGQVKTGDVLPKGFYVFAQPVASQSATARASRVAPPISCLAIGAGALHGLIIGVTFQP
jgi:Protein of unknown function (DUF3383)